MSCEAEPGAAVFRALSFGVKPWTRKRTAHMHSGDHVSQCLEVQVSEVHCSAVEPKLVPSDLVPRPTNPCGEQKSLSLWPYFQPPAFRHGWSTRLSYHCSCHFSFFLAPALPVCPKASPSFVGPALDPTYCAQRYLSSFSIFSSCSSEQSQLRGSWGDKLQSGRAVLFTSGTVSTEVSLPDCSGEQYRCTHAVPSLG